MPKTSKMKETLKSAAIKADLNGRRCTKCALHPCSALEFRVCCEAFRDGFRKGALWKSKVLKLKGGSDGL